MKSLPLVNTCWLRPFKEHFTALGRDIDDYLQVAGIEPQLVVDGEGWITKRQLYHFLNDLAAGENIPEVGFVVGERLTVDCLGALGGAMAGAGNLAEALRLFCRLVPRHVEDNRLWVEESDRGEVWLFNEVVDRVEAESDIADHAGLMTLVNVIRLAAGPGWYPERMALQAAPTDAWKRVPALKDREVKFGREATGVAFPVALLLEPVGIEAAERKEVPTGGLLSGDEALHQKIAELLRSVVGVGGVLPSVHLTAEMAGTSPRTLHRRLREEDHTYQEILDEVRFERATHLLRHSDATVKEIAMELGFSGANNFIRYFRRLAGVTPQIYRSRNEEGPRPVDGTP